MRAFPSAYKLTGVLTAAAVVLIASHAHGATVYSYTGNNFDIFSGASFDNTMSVSGSFTMANPLPANQSAAIFFTPMSFSFSDGVGTVTDLNASLFSFQVATDSFGNISGWNISMSAGDINVPGGEINTVESLTVVDVGVLTLCAARSSIGTCTSEATGQFGLTASHGTWSTAVLVTPLPSALPLFATGLGALGLLGWRRKKKLDVQAQPAR